MMKKTFKIDSYYLKQYQEEDLLDFIDIFMNEELCKYMEGGAFDKKTDAENLFYSFLDLNEMPENNCNYYKIIHNKKTIGHFEIVKNTFTKINELEIVYLLKKNYWGKGIMKKIIEFINNNVKEQIIIRIKVNNNNSRKLIEKITKNKPTLCNFNNYKVIKYTLKK